jgi:dTDP-4-dehydrorhamnose 3,5-epimerase
MNIRTTDIPGLYLVEPRVFADERGFFMETYQQRVFEAAGLPTHFVQDNHAGSRQGSLRGMHYQIQQAQGKLVRVIAGAVFDVAVDLRRSSPTFGRWFGTHLTAENRCMFWVPAGFAHGYYVLSEWAEFVYKATDFYAPQHEHTLLWNDPAVGIEWPLIEGLAPILSAKDTAGKPLADADTYE